MIEIHRQYALVNSINPKAKRDNKGRIVRRVEVDLLVPNQDVHALGNAMGTGCNPSTVFWDGKGDRRTNAITKYHLGYAVFEKSHRLSLDFDPRTDQPRVVEDVEKVWAVTVEPQSGLKMALGFKLLILQPSQKAHTVEKLHSKLEDLVEVSLLIRPHHADLLGDAQGVDEDRSTDKKAAKDG